MDELSDVQSGAQRIEHRPVIKIGPDFAVDLRLRNGDDLVVGQGSQLLLRLQHSLVVGGMKRQRELPEPLKVTVDAIVVHQFLDGVDGVVVCPEHFHGTGAPIPLYRGVEADRQSRGGHPSVAAGGTPPDRVPFNDSNTGSLFGELERLPRAR